ncbi:MAG: hypothetical protein IKF90_07270 [Parasporobacterium sp.]|nr:hypothetical protein [Parasporobacterium sp.]
MNYTMVNWKEFGASGRPSVRETFVDGPYPFKHKIIEYLRSGNIGAAAAKSCYDAFTGEMIAPKYELMHDGEYVWNTAVPYYVERYNMRLPEAFVDKILS